MEFLTIHDLSREFNIPARVVRYRLSSLIGRGKLQEGEDYRREDFKDDQHFIWKVNPLSFIRETRYQRVAKPLTNPLPPVNLLETDGNQNQNSSENHGSQPVNQPASSVNKVVNENPQPVIKPLPNPVALAEDRKFEREMIDLLKEQIRVKDEQFKDQGKQLKDMTDLNLKLNGAVIAQAEKIENLLRLSDGNSKRPEPSINVNPQNGEQPVSEAPQSSPDPFARAA
jgi:hypothetical protein